MQDVLDNVPEQALHFSGAISSDLRVGICTWDPRILGYFENVALMRFDIRCR